ncbi:MAG: pyridoxamine 5'-phosphate oxidase family protein [Bacillota bacterium]
MPELRRKDREETKEFALNLFKNCQYATLATVNPDGTPYCIPISPVLINDYLYFHSAKIGQKITNIMSNPSVCVSCVGYTKLIPEQFTTEFASAVAHGQIEIIEDEKEKITVLKQLCLKYAATNMDNFEKAIEASLNRTGIYKIIINCITEKSKKIK